MLPTFKVVLPYPESYSQTCTEDGVHNSKKLTISITTEQVRLPQTRGYNHVLQTHGGQRPPAAASSGTNPSAASRKALATSTLILTCCLPERQNKLIILNLSESCHLSSVGTDMWPILLFECMPRWVLRHKGGCPVQNCQRISAQ